jgi:hypothetical protein
MSAWAQRSVLASLQARVSAERHSELRLGSALRLVALWQDFEVSWPTVTALQLRPTRVWV